MKSVWTPGRWHWALTIVTVMETYKFVPNVCCDGLTLHGHMIGVQTDAAIRQVLWLQHFCVFRCQLCRLRLAWLLNCPSMYGLRLFLIQLVSRALSWAWCVCHVVDRWPIVTSMPFLTTFNFSIGFSCLKMGTFFLESWKRSAMSRQIMGCR